LYFVLCEIPFFCVVVESFSSLKLACLRSPLEFKLGIRCWCMCVCVCVCVCVQRSMTCLVRVCVTARAVPTTSSAIASRKPVPSFRLCSRETIDLSAAANMPSTLCRASVFACISTQFDSTHPLYTREHYAWFPALRFRSSVSVSVTVSIIRVAKRYGKIELDPV